MERNQVLDLVVCVMANHGAPMEFTELANQVRRELCVARKRDIRLVLEVLRDVGQVRQCDGDVWEQCPVEYSVWNYDPDSDDFLRPRNCAWLDK
jgi:hypothetical protein